MNEYRNNLPTEIESEEMAHLITRELWRFLASTGFKKDDFDPEIEIYYCGCPLCQWYFLHGGCEACCLSPSNLCAKGGGGDAYRKWFNSIKLKERKRNARRILKAIDYKCRLEGWA